MRQSEPERIRKMKQRIHNLEAVLASCREEFKNLERDVAGHNSEEHFRQMREMIEEQIGAKP